ncbi:hypothetical protein ACFFK0_02640 [Paenibacillus chartarius]|uniref:Uncharacterized protein n=1 Tax=Paenibacillus chartarius TaxID=747481 RepID=A0ABV6DFD1_9BACL
MSFELLQQVRIVDMNNELLTEVTFRHGSYTGIAVAVGATVISYPLGLKEFEVVYDRRSHEPAHYKIVDIELDLLAEPVVTRVLLEKVTLIVGQHDVGQIVE